MEGRETKEVGSKTSTPLKVWNMFELTIVDNVVETIHMLANKVSVWSFPKAWIGERNTAVDTILLN